MSEPETAPSVNIPKANYLNWLGFIFIFNIIVGTKVLTLPAVFYKAGWLLSLMVVLVLAIIAYITVTFIIESMAAANAVKLWQHAQENEITYDPSFEFHRLDEKFEIGEMTAYFFNHIGRVIFYLSICIYLYGALSVYSAALAKTVRDVICEYSRSNISLPSSAILCWQTNQLSRNEIYRITLVIFTCMFGPFAAFNVTTTKYLQLIAIVCRWISFALMIAIAVYKIITENTRPQPPTMNIYGVPKLFGSCVYAFMCHHSLPGLLAPIRDKKGVVRLIFIDYMVVCVFFVVLAMTGIFAFEHIKDVYTLNFVPEQHTQHGFQANLMLYVNYFLSLFPAYTVSTNYPVLCITLRSNLQALFLDMDRLQSYNFFLRRILFPLMTVLPPFTVTFFTENITSLVAYTGSYGGTMIQYVIPAALVYCARKTCEKMMGTNMINDYRSPFRSTYWVIFVFVWSAVCVSMVTLNLFRKT